MWATLEAMMHAKASTMWDIHVCGRHVGRSVKTPLLEAGISRSSLKENCWSRRAGLSAAKCTISGTQLLELAQKAVLLITHFHSASFAVMVASCSEPGLERGGVASTREVLESQRGQAACASLARLQALN